jgi:hypothetical protein
MEFLVTNPIRLKLTNDTETKCFNQFEWSSYHSWLKVEDLITQIPPSSQTHETSYPFFNTQGNWFSGMALFRCVHKS